MEQSHEEMVQKIKKASRRKILRRQMELLAEWCRVSYFGQKQIPRATKEMIALNKELFKTERVLFVCFIIMFFTFSCFFKFFTIKGIKFFKR